MRDLTPTTRRLSRMRRTSGLRGLVRETTLQAEDLILPLFVAEQNSDAGEISSMPGVRRFSLDEIDAYTPKIAESGLRAVLLFGIPAHKDAQGCASYAEHGVIPQAIQRIRRQAPDLVIITDVCLCAYTDHGHCGLVDGRRIQHDATCEVLGRIACVHARSGADIVAPSAMIDGMVGSIRAALDARSLKDCAILSYAIKYASSFYGPFREAAECAPQFGDRRSHQMDPANIRQALSEAHADLAEGADMLMVKPAMPYLDVVKTIRDRIGHVPLAAYQVSGEYAMIKAAGHRGWIDEQACVLESLTAIKRAGADMIISYFALDAVRHLQTRRSD